MYMQRPLVSIIVPVYNVEKYLKRCIQSLLQQTYKHIEIILVDDGSLDQSGIMCDKISQEDIRVKVVHKKNAGLGMARNTGMEWVTGKYVMFVDSDDYINIDAVQKLLELAISFNVEVVLSRFIYDDCEEESTIATGLYDGEDRVKELLTSLMGNGGKKDQINVSSCTKMYLVDFLKKTGIKFPSERELIWEDLAFNFEVFLNVKRAYVSKYAYYHYCYNTMSLTHRYIPDKFEKIMIMYEYMSQKIAAHNLSEDSKVRVDNMFMGNIRTCIKLEAYYFKKNGLKASINNIKEISSDSRVQKLVSEIPNKEMTKQQVLYNWFITNKMPVVLFLLAALQNVRKKNLIN